MTPLKITPELGPVTVELDVGDALMLGLSIRTLARTCPDPTTSALYNRVGAQLVAAARAKALVPR